MSKPTRDQETDPEEAGWLLRQWQRLRSWHWRDVIITQIGDNAQNVAVGKYIFQLNVAGRNLAIPVIWIALALLFFVGLTVAYLTQGYWNPTPMTGALNIAIADFGVINADGSVTADTLGSDLSRAVFTQLTSAAQETNTLATVTFRHDSLGRSVKNVRLGVIHGRTEAERTAYAAALAQRINADLVVYGHLRADKDPAGLEVQFYIRSRTLNTDPGVIDDRHRLGAAIVSPVSASADATLTKADMEQSLANRTTAIFWLIRALTQSFVNKHEQALALLQEAEMQLQTWEPTEGKEVLYNFLGREALLLHRFEIAIPAFEAALAINPAYVNALLGLAGVYYDRAQLFFLRGRELSAAEQKCVIPGDYDQGAATLPDALADLEVALAKYQQAVTLAPTAASPRIGEMAQMGLGLAYQFQGQALIFANELDRSDQALEQARPVLQTLLPAFADDALAGYLARTYQGLAMADRLQAHIRLVRKSEASNAQNEPQAQVEQKAAIALLQQGLTQTDACLAQRDKLASNPLFTQYVLECGCVPLAQDIRQVLTANPTPTLP